MSGLYDDVEVYAVPGHNNIIDTINHQTGLSRFSGQTQAEVMAREPAAVRMTWEAWKAAVSARQRTPITWEPSTAEQYDEMLNVLPPAMWVGGAFLVGEPMDHDVMDGQPRFSAYWQRASGYYVASRPLTRAELRAELAAAR